MQTNEIRKKFVDYFTRNDHKLVPSSSLVPHNDPTLLFANAGMNQFKEVFTGQETRPYQRAVSVQKCVRAGGKHNDLENVGFTARHHTFFEMLGNFSFGDYFKIEAIKHAWTFLTQELGLPIEKLYVTVHLEDDEAAEIWQDVIKVPKTRIFRFDEDNFWSMGETGPCGPCSEIFVDRGQEYGCGNAECTMGCECDRFLEVWNLVFMQFDRGPDGQLTPLPNKCVDTGAGLERLAMVLANAPTNYETDAFMPILTQIGELCGKPYTTNGIDVASYRVIADHARAATFLIADGVMPSNEGRGYVLRRIIRRAIRHGRKLGFERPFFADVAQVVISQMGAYYTELRDKGAFVRKILLTEENQFLRTLEKGLLLLEEELSKVSENKTLSGQVAFKLYDTFGFPVDLTRVICAEAGYQVDEEVFAEEMASQKNRSRKNWQGSGEEAPAEIYAAIEQRLHEQHEQSRFVGYTTTRAEGTCLALIAADSNGRVVNDYDGEEAFEAVFSETPFYGESGGQIGDQGIVENPQFRGRVLDTQKPRDGLTVVKIQPERGRIAVGRSYLQVVDNTRRQLAAKNHSATHLLHAALRRYLGDHVKQAGSFVGDDLLRFDFSHFEGLTQQDLNGIERLVNQQIFSSTAVTMEETSQEEASAKGAIAFFGEKYGDRVRVVTMGDFSIELCGGTHVQNTSEIHAFKIVSEASVAAGVRRIVAVTSGAALEQFREIDDHYQVIKARLKGGSQEQLLDKIDKMESREKELVRELDQLKLRAARRALEQTLAATDRNHSNDALLFTHQLEPDSKGAKLIRELAEEVANTHPDSVGIYGMAANEPGKAFLLACVGTNAQKSLGYDAGKIIKKIAPLIDGKGGGKKNIAQAGGTNPAKLTEALQEGLSWLQSGTP